MPREPSGGTRKVTHREGDRVTAGGGIQNALSSRRATNGRKWNDWPGTEEIGGICGVKHHVPYKGIELTFRLENLASRYSLTNCRAPSKNAKKGKRHAKLEVISRVLFDDTGVLTFIF